MEPVIRNRDEIEDRVLHGPEDGVPTSVMLYLQHAPGESSAHHQHPWEHQAYITEGAGILWVDGVEYRIRAGDAVLVPPGAVHHFTNTGDVPLGRVTVNPLSSVEG
jgi:quercetin dioxygenase-like cupin family protein